MTLLGRLLICSAPWMQAEARYPVFMPFTCHNQIPSWQGPHLPCGIIRGCDYDWLFWVYNEAAITIGLLVGRCSVNQRKVEHYSSCIGAHKASSCLRVSISQMQIYFQDCLCILTIKGTASNNGVYHCLILDNMCKSLVI